MGETALRYALCTVPAASCQLVVELPAASCFLPPAYCLLPAPAGPPHPFSVGLDYTFYLHGPCQAPGCGLKQRWSNYRRSLGRKQVRRPWSPLNHPGGNVSCLTPSRAGGGVSRSRLPRQFRVLDLPRPDSGPRTRYLVRRLPVVEVGLLHRVVGSQHSVERHLLAPSISETPGGDSCTDRSDANLAATEFSSRSCMRQRRPWGPNTAWVGPII